MKLYRKIASGLALLALVFGLTACEQKNLVYAGHSEVVDEKWGDIITTDVEIVFNPNDYSFTEVEREYVVEKDAPKDSGRVTVFRRKGEYAANFKKGGDLILYYNGESKNGGQYYHYVEDVVYTLDKGVFYYGWDESIKMSVVLVEKISD